MRDRVVGAMLGLACGDALGAPAEFMSAEDLRAKWGVLTDMTGGGSWEPGEWTDDTGMALCVAEGLLEAPEDPVDAIGRGFMQWLHSSPKDVGGTIRSALSAYHGDWPDASRNTPAARSGKAAGNGSLMRTLPVALAHCEAEPMLLASARVSAMTHWDPQAEVCCAVYCLWIERLLHGEEPLGAWEKAIGDGRAAAGKGRRSMDTPGPGPLPPGFWDRLAGVARKRRDELQPTGYAGYVVDCLEAAVWCCMKADSLEQALISAVNLAGEADTIAAVAGGAAGAMWGLDAVPCRWLEVLHRSDHLTGIGNRLADLRRHHEVYGDGGFGGTPGLPPLEFQEVTERVYAGRNPLTARDVDTLVAAGITHIIDLRESTEWTAPGRLGLEAIEALERHGVVRRHLPVRDVAEPTSRVLHEASGCLDTWLADPNHRVYVHCRAGRERTGAILVGWYARKHGLRYAQALDRLREHRHELSPVRCQEEAVS